MHRESGVLLAVLATPPLTTTGARTRRRLELAAGIVGCRSVEVVNLLGIPTSDVLAIPHAGAAADPWIASRGPIEDGLSRAGAVLFGWGCTAPTGSARQHHRTQVDWIVEQSGARGLHPWMVGAEPRHPSRWQRHTARAFPGLSFGDALAAALRRSGPPERSLKFVESTLNAGN